VKKAVCILEDRGQSSAIKWEDEARPIIVFCLIMFVSTCLAHNATKLSLLNKPFLLIKSCVFCVHDMPSFFMLFRANNTWAHPSLTKSLHQEFFGVFPFFPKKCMIPCFHKDF
jgi:hypothetical protein